MVDAACQVCGQQKIDILVDRDAPKYPTCRCGRTMTRLLSVPAAVHGDDIPGGLLVEHGLCGPGGEPRRYYSKSEMAREAKRRGLTNWVEHVPDKGSDKAAFTQRFV